MTRLEDYRTYRPLPPSTEPRMLPEDSKIANEILADMDALRKMEAWAPFPPFSDGFLNETNPEAKDDHKD